MRPKRIYLDSNVFITIADAEIGRNVRGLFVEAAQFVDEVTRRKDIIVLSSWFFEEVMHRAHLGREEVLDYFNKNSLNFEVVDDKADFDFRHFRKIGLHFNDAVHVTIAIASKCDCIVTFNIKDFEKAKDLIDIFEPADYH